MWALGGATAPVTGLRGGPARGGGEQSGGGRPAYGGADEPAPAVLHRTRRTVLRPVGKGQEPVAGC